MALIGGAEERAAIQSEKSMGLKKRGDEKRNLGSRGEERRCLKK
jgi:hypothetical protein